MSARDAQLSRCAAPSATLSCDERKVLVASLVTLAAESAHLDLAGARAARASRAVRDQALALAARALDAPDERRLDEFLAAWAGDTALVVEQHARHASHGEHRALRDFAGAVRRDAEGHRCRVCPGGEAELCGPRVRPEVAARGACLGELQGMFDDALVLARALYARAGVAATLVQQVRPSLCVARLAPRVGRLLADLPIDASCWYSAPCDGRCVIVLAVPVEELSLRVMRGIPYVLLHELVAHAFQRLGARERATSARDPVAEGWTKMEYRQGDVRDRTALEEAFA
ncbi:MAG: hypothetical protein ACLGIK_16390, partial [Gemmatimonadota bacterium]